ncbi:hypothetical protein JXQ31_20355 [candidate division KSB1 bacterium]|nr:hypothetical protein [candidate division KSB1 bacterium]
MIKLPEPRKFNYRFRYYKPEEEEENRIHFKRIRKSKQPAKGSSIRLVVLLVIVFLVVFFLVRQKKNILIPSSNTISIEEIEVVD